MLEAVFSRLFRHLRGIFPAEAGGTESLAVPAGGQHLGMGELQIAQAVRADDAGNLLHRVVTCDESFPGIDIGLTWIALVAALPIIIGSRNPHIEPLSPRRVIQT